MIDIDEHWLSIAASKGTRVADKTMIEYLERTAFEGGISGYLKDKAEKDALALVQSQLSRPVDQVFELRSYSVVRVSVKAVCVSKKGVYAWLPLSEILSGDYNKLETLVMPLWLAKKKHFT